MDASDIRSRLARAANITAPFCCGGSLQPEPQCCISICYKPASGASSTSPSPSPSTSSIWRSLTLPSQDAGLIEDLVSACSPATFGLKQETVLDPSYRNSLKLDPSDFIVSFNLAEYSVLGHVKKLLFPRPHGMMVAKLYKLNVYNRGHFFKPHVDTPRGNQQVASLVVSLPSSYEGGDLLVRHDSRAHRFKWGDGNNNSKICWAAFYSDCEHEIEEVKTGYRITLTYNLYLFKPHIEEPAGAIGVIDYSETDLCNLFCEAAKNAGEKTVLGFPCKHYYPFHESDTKEVIIPDVLKGADAYIYAAALAAGLTVTVRRVWGPCYRSGLDTYHNNALYVEQEMDAKFQVSNYRYESGKFDMRQALKVDVKEDEKLQWCGNAFQWHLGGACLRYGNDATTQAIYCIAAVLVTIHPAMSETESREHKRSRSNVL